MMLAEFSGTDIGMLVFTAGLFLVALIALLKKQEVKVEQPLNVEIVERLVTKEDFQAHVIHADKIHGELFSKIGSVGSVADINLDRKVTAISTELTSQGKEIAGLKKETELQNQSLAAVQSDIKIILGRIPRNSHER